MRFLATILISMICTLESFGAVKSCSEVFETKNEVLLWLNQLDISINAEELKLSSEPRPLTREWVKQKIHSMVEVDQIIRKYQLPITIPHSDQEKFQKPWAEVMNHKDQEHTSILKSLIKKYGWFSISQWGAETDRNAWLLVQHADDDAEFQETVLLKLEVLIKSNDTFKPNFAYLYDRIAVSYNDPSKRKLQRFGTQGKCSPEKQGLWIAYPIENPETFEKLRADFGLDQFKEYQASMNKYCE